MGAKVFFRLGVFVILLFSMGCGGAGGDGSSKDSGGDSYPTFSEGGTLSLTAQGQQSTVKIDDVQLANTDSGNPDYLDIAGPGTHLFARIDPKMPDGKGDTDYKPLVGRTLPMDLSKDIAREDRIVTIPPNPGKYPVISGSITMEKFQIGMDGRDMWEGRIELVLQTAQGPVTVPGTFKFCVVPVW